MSLRNHYVSVMHEGKLIPWTGPNPERDNREGAKDAVRKAKALNEAAGRRCAYAVEVIEILPEDLVEPEVLPKGVGQ